MGFKQLWAWYGRVGRPIVLHSNYSLATCQKRLEENSLPWNKRAPLSAKFFRLELQPNGQFRLQYRRPLSHLAGRIFEGKLTAVPDGGTQISGIIHNERSFLGFLALVFIIAPLGGFVYWDTRGFMIGLTIALLLGAAALFVRFTEEKSSLWRTFHDWLCETLDAQDVTLPAFPPSGE